MMLIFDGLLELLTELYLKARAELGDPVTLRRRLLELETMHAWGDIDETSYRAEAERLHGLLAACRTEEEEEE